MPQRLVTGIKPTGDIHIGNYFGLIKPLLDLYAGYESFVFIADLHALNQIHGASELRRLSREIAVAYLACGLDPQKAALFRQSEVPAHAELCWIFNCITSMGLLERAHAYKDAQAKGKPINLGLFDYPVLMAADILIYQADVVPVGKDQQQHLEMAVDIAERFHTLFGKAFTLPKGVISESTGTVPGLDGRKMSKSYANVIGLFDSPEVLAKKVKGIVTDSRTPEEPKDPDSCAVFAFHRLFSQAELPELEKRYREGGISYRESKEILLRNLQTFLAPIQERKAVLEKQAEYLDGVLEAGRQQAEKVASATLSAVKELTGLR